MGTGPERTYWLRERGRESQRRLGLLYERAEERIREAEQRLLTTVGYGDLAPETTAGKLFTVFYIFTGIGLIVAFLNAVARTAVEQRDERRGLLGRRNRRRTGSDRRWHRRGTDSARGPPAKV